MPSFNASANTITRSAIFLFKAFAIDKLNIGPYQLAARFSSRHFQLTYFFPLPLFTTASPPLSRMYPQSEDDIIFILLPSCYFAEGIHGLLFLPFRIISGMDCTAFSFTPL
jgi:hypothetical protein